MTSSAAHSLGNVQPRTWLFLGLGLVLVFAVIAIGVVQYNQKALMVTTPYAPYTVSEKPYAPYTAGPVVHEQAYAPYTAGPVVRETPFAAYTEKPYAPYTAGPVIHKIEPQ
jgi:hypothetical protein